MDVDIYMRRLERIASAIGVDERKDKEEEADTSGMNAYEKGRYKCALMMATVREDAATLEGLEGSASTARKTEVSNRIRRNLRELRNTSQALRKTASAHKKIEDYNELNRHIKKTESMYKARFRTGEMLESEEPSGFGDSAVPLKTYTRLDGNESCYGTMDTTAALVDPSQDQEFQQYLMQAKQRDQEIDQGLAQVHAGVMRLKENALETAVVLDAQSKALDSINEKSGELALRLKGINGKLKETLDSVEKDKYCCYLLCCILILGVLSIILTQTGVVGK